MKRMTTALILAVSMPMMAPSAHATQTETYFRESSTFDSLTFSQLEAAVVADNPNAVLKRIVSVGIQDYGQDVFLYEEDATPADPHSRTITTVSSTPCPSDVFDPDACIAGYLKISDYTINDFGSDYLSYWEGEYELNIYDGDSKDTLFITDVFNETPSGPQHSWVAKASNGDVVASGSMSSQPDGEVTLDLVIHDVSWEKHTGTLLTYAGAGAVIGAATGWTVGVIGGWAGGGPMGGLWGGKTLGAAMADVGWVLGAAVGLGVVVDRIMDEVNALVEAQGASLTAEEKEELRKELKEYIKSVKKAQDTGGGTPTAGDIDCDKFPLMCDLAGLEFEAPDFQFGYQLQ